MSSIPPPPPTDIGTKQKKPIWKRRWFLISVGSLVGLGVIGSFISQGETDEDGMTVTETSDNSAGKSSSEEPEPTPTSVAPTTTAVATTTATETTVAAVVVPPSTATPATQADSISLMPLIPCGTDLQLAQDLVQEAGVFLSLSEDATGQGRMQIRDRNWTVLYSTPEPGTPIGEGDAVFFVVKDEEFQGC